MVDRNSQCRLPVYSYRVCYEKRNYLNLEGLGKSVETMLFMSMGCGRYRF